ncbi:class I SAM-dependent methyltransferase [Pseudofrankia sp. DC12]|uniref:class I SAM-dependent methyltransferase n=1 Tax=Pseudofrankia sp. DC12 TaxID=683315 RepID=UPI0005F7A554|nr:class I SAM-dependent methyltransferase [Pseudofrankia sp. DC12]
MTDVAAGPALYDGYAQVFADEAAVSAYNAHYDRPAVLGLLGDVTGLTVLDAGCGPGLYATELLRGGAHVIGCDASTDMIALAHRRLGPGPVLRQHDLNRPLDWLPDASADLALLALVIHYLDNRAGALREIYRVLRPGGALVISTSHPTADWQASDGGYFDARHEQEQWSCGLTHRYWRQPLQNWIAEFTAAGFLLKALVEHQPQPRMARTHPAVFARLSREPGFIAYRLAKPPDTAPAWKDPAV